VNIVVPIIVFVTLGLLSFQLAARSMEPDERRQLLRLVYLAFALRVVMSIIFELSPDLRFFHEDANGYEGMGLRLAESWRGRFPPVNLPAKNYGFFVMAGLLYYCFGTFAVNVALFNSVIGSVTMILIYRLANRLFHTRVALMAAGLVGFMPSMILWSAIALKDALATFLIVVALSSCISLREKITFNAVMGIVLPIVALQPIRFYIVYFVLFSIVVAMALDPSEQIVGRLYKQLVVAGAIVAFFAMLGIAGSAVQGTEQFDLRFVQSYRVGMAVTAKSGYALDADISTPRGALSFLPQGVATLLLAPFPWQMTSFRALVAAPETIIWWLLFPATLRGMGFVLRRRFTPVMPLVLFMLSLTGAYGVSQGNVGAAFRQRAQIFVFLFIFTALGWYVKKCRKLGIDPKLLLRNDGQA
jgi:hypothetical protein